MERIRRLRRIRGPVRRVRQRRGSRGGKPEVQGLARAQGGGFAAREGRDRRARGELPQRLVLRQREEEQQGSKGSFVDVIHEVDNLFECEYQSRQSLSVLLVGTQLLLSINHPSQARPRKRARSSTASLLPPRRRDARADLSRRIEDNGVGSAKPRAPRVGDWRFGGSERSQNREWRPRREGRGGRPGCRNNATRAPPTARRMRRR